MREAGFESGEEIFDMETFREDPRLVQREQDSIPFLTCMAAYFTNMVVTRSLQVDCVHPLTLS